MSTLKDQLPAGSARNKIEFLAELMEMTVAELYEKIAGLGGAENLLVNPKFNEGWTSQSGALAHMVRSMHMTAGVKPDLSLTVGNGRGSMLVTNGWAMEVPFDKTQSYPALVANGRPMSWKQTVDRESGALQVLCRDFTLYQVVTVPMNGMDHTALKGRFTLTGVKGSTVTVGIAKLSPYSNSMVLSWRYGENTYVMDKDHHIDEPITVETKSVDLYQYARSGPGMFALFLKVENGGSAYIYDAALWHSGVHGDSPARFINRRQPDSYGHFIDSDPLSGAAKFETVAPNTIKYSFNRHFPYMYDPRQHLIINCRDYKSAKVTDIKPDSFTIEFSQADYTKLNGMGDFGYNFWLQYSSMPVGLGFYR
ncbi:hypothetical protein [Photobacterium alginatilyticum]|uniref:Uncharacterized protein n=1 Tax=Photobacterium alginatilyticum TaxID=1775171 RepID=A0ABW9YNP6_9GAMM|nr:hypothetical protein [Photobacterium alginatilyticum]NBI55453.1 hypothetical protein [Photobacterium alginatilyticum]